MKNMFKKVFALLLVLAMMLTMAACGGAAADAPAAEGAEGGGEAAQAPEVIKVGVLCSLTGNSQTNGGYARQGATMAMEEINAAGGIDGKQIELIFEDDGGKADTAINAYNKLKSQNVVAIVGPMLSGLALAMDQDVQAGQIPLLIGATSAALTNDIDNAYFHRLRCSDTIMAQVAASYAVSNYNAQKIGIFFCSDDYGSGAKNTIAQWCDANGVAYYEAGHNAGDKDMSTQILKIKEEGCDVVIMWAHDDECALAARQFYEQGLTVPVISSTTIATPQVYSLCNAEWIEGWNYVTDFIATNPAELVQTFVNAYTEKYGEGPEIYSATYYNGVYAFADVAKRAGSVESAALCDALKTIELETLYGVYTANDKRELAHTAIIGVMKDLVPSYQDQVTME